MKDKELKLEEVKVPHTLGGSSYMLILILYINSTKEVVSHLEVELYKPRIISLTVDSCLVVITNGPVSMCDRAS
jgi:hypothetical protein